MSNKTYDMLKKLSQTVLPALGTLYYAIAEVWGFSFGQEVVATILAIDTFLGVLLEVSSAKYYKNKEGSEKNEL